MLRVALALGIVVLSALPASADAFLLLERDQDAQGQTDLFLISYADQGAFLTNGNATQTALPHQISSAFSAGGLTVDAGGGWHLLLERDIDLPGQTDLFLISYADQGAFLTNSNATQTALPHQISSAFSAGGFTIDAGGGWHLLLERDQDAQGQTDLFLISYADQGAFLTNSNATQTALPHQISSAFSAGGLTIDAGGGWHLLLERDQDAQGQTDLFLISYADQGAFLTNGNATQTALPHQISSAFSAGGLHFTGATPSAVPEPSLLAMLALGAMAVARFRR